MTEKNLPIKFFSKRFNDELNTEGNGGSSIPKWINSISDLRDKATKFTDLLNDLSSTLSQKEKEQNLIPNVIKVKIISDAIAKSHRKKIDTVFNTKKLNTIAFHKDNELIVKIENNDDLKNIFRNINVVKTNNPSKDIKIALSAIDTIEHFKPTINTSSSKNTILKVTLFNYHNPSLNNFLSDRFETFCNTLNLKYKSIAYTGELNIYRIDSITKDNLNKLKEFEGIEFISDMPVYDINTDSVDQKTEFPVKFPKANTLYPTIGVLDSGIAPIKHLSPWLCKENITYYPEEYTDKGHGTFVAGILLYGDELENKKYTGLEGCNIFEALVMPNPQIQSITEDELITQIWDAISRNPDIKIWNMSLGTKQEADKYEFSDFAKALDDIQEQFNVLICKSAGNTNNFIENKSAARIARSADTVRGLVVGSIAQSHNTSDIAEKNNVSPFSRIGLGPAYLIKPDVVHYGGNAGLSNSNKLTINPVKSFSTDDNISGNIGTSFSTPRISAISAGLYSSLNESFNPELIKALIIHSAKYPKEMQMNIEEKIKCSGFGLPNNINNILFNSPHEITLILCDKLEKGHFIDILDFPFPETLVDDNGYYCGEITVTLVTSPILEDNQGSEYCQSNIEVKLGTYNKKVKRDLSKKNIKNPIGTDERKNVLALDNYSKKASKITDIPFANERILISYDRKYQPVKKWCVNLNEFTDGNKNKYLKSPKNWYLKLEGLYRQFTEEKCNLINWRPKQNFCLIITVKDPTNRKNIYNEVSQLLDINNFVHNDIKIREDVRLRINN